MNYVWHYDRLIETRKTRIREKGVYYERHHVVMKSMGGTDEESNLVWLTAREHFLAHWLLWKIHRNRQAAYAFSVMRRRKGCQTEVKLSSRMYAELRECARISASLRKKSVEERKKISEKLKGNQNAKGHSYFPTKEVKSRISKSLTGRKRADEICEKISKGKTGKKRPDMAEVNARRKGKTQSEEHKKNKNLALKRYWEEVKAGIRKR